MAEFVKTGATDDAQKDMIEGMFKEKIETKFKRRKGEPKIFEINAASSR